MVSLVVFFDFLSNNSLLFTLFFIGFFFYISRRYGIVFMKTELNEENNYCNDKNCVRCNKYNGTIVNAMQKIPSIKDRVISIRIQKGLDFIHRPLDAGFKQRPNVFYYDNLTAVNIWDKKFGDCSTLENNYKIILSEVEYLMDNNYLGVWKKNTTPNGSWDVFHLINQGSAVQENQALCPQTMNILNSLSAIMNKNVFGNVLFSLLKPGTEITPHYGPTNIRLRCHLGLQVTPECLLTVDGETVTWQLGKCLLFDDSFLHSVTHSGNNMSRDQPSSANRIVLIVDMWHPDLSLNERDAIDLCFQACV